MYSYAPNAIVIARACQLWRRMLEDPVYDNGDNSFRGMFTNYLMSSLPRNNEPEILDKFEDQLFMWLSVPTKYDSDFKSIVVDTKSGHYEQSLHVDYGPDTMLRQAAEAAGLKMQFPIKTNMYLYETHLSVRNGYSAPEMHHYYLDDAGSQWAVTGMDGTPQEMAKLLIDIRYGNHLNVHIDNDPPSLLGKELYERLSTVSVEPSSVTHINIWS